MTVRRLQLAAAALALLFVDASAQVNQPGGGGGTLACSVLLSNNPTAVRPEGYSESLGDIIITCHGGSQTGFVPLVNVTVALNNTVVTSRVFANGLSEALLLIDEPGGGIAVSPGGLLPQTLCSGGALGAGPGGCETQPGAVGAYRGAVLSSDTSVVPNVFQGVVSGNQVVFQGIPLLAPVTAGLARVFRITNLRGNANQFAAEQAASPANIPILASVSISSGVLLSNPISTVGFLYPGSSTSVRNAANTAAGSSINVNQCFGTPLTPGATLRFTEGFAWSFKSRISRTSALTGAATPHNSIVTASAFTQNVPTIGQPPPDSESGFILPVTGGTAGLADFGTRLKATFHNVPAGVSIYVSTHNLGANAADMASGNIPNGATIAALVSGESVLAPAGASLPLVAPNTNSGGVSLFGPLPVDATGTALAVWEVLGSNILVEDNLDFAVYYSATAGVSPVPPPGAVSLSLAPTFGSATAGASLPRFAAESTAANLINETPCYLVSMASSVNPSSYRQPVTFTATVSGGASLPSAITFTDGGTVLGSAPLISGQAIFTTTILTPGTHSIWGLFDGVVIMPHTQTVNKAAAATVLSGPAAVTAGGQAVYTVTVTGAFGGSPTGVVTFRDGGTAIGSAVLTNGSATLIPSLSTGAHSITAVYSGDANFLTSTSAAVTTGINLRTTSVGRPAITSGTPGQTVTISATVAGEGPLTGMLTFRDNGALLGVAAIDGSGTGSVSATLGAGSHVITASYSGDVFNASATSDPLFLNLRRSSTTTLTSTPNPATPGAALTFTATVAGASGSTTPTGSVTFTNGSTVLGSVALNGSAQAVLTIAAGLPAGEHRIVAAYGGETNFEPSTSAVLVQRVVRPATTTTLTESAGANGFALIAAVATESGTPTGAVEFRDLTAGTELGAAILANGVASITVGTPLPVGHTVQAVYVGDGQFDGSASTPQPFIAAANAFSFALSFAPDSVASIFGAGLAGETASAGPPLPTTLGGVEVRVADSSGRQYPAMLYFVSPGQINFVVPPAVPVGPARLLIVRGSDALSLSIAIAPSAPSLASADGSGSGTAAAHLVRLHPDGAQDSPVAVTSAAIPVEGDRLFLILYGTGLRHGGSQLTCTMNGQAVPVLFAGAHGQYPGLDQVNLEIPALLRGLISVACSTAGGISNTVTLTVR